MKTTQRMSLVAASIGLATWANCAGAAMIQPNQMRASNIVGTDVYDRQNEDVATVKDLVLNRDGQVVDVVLSYGTTMGVGGKYVAIPFGSLKFDNNRLTIDETKAQLNEMPKYTITDSNTGAGQGAVPPTGGHAQ